MVSKLKQQLRESLRPLGAAPAPSNGAGQATRIQTLRIEGHAELDLGSEKIQTTSPLVGGIRFFVGAWLSRTVFAHGERDEKGNFALTMPVDTRADEDLLKVEVYALMRDPETQITKPIPLGAGLVCMHQLCDGHANKRGTQASTEHADGRGTQVSVIDSIMQVKVCQLELRATQPVDTSRLVRSAMYGVEDHNRALGEITSRVEKLIKTNGIRVPEVAAPFVNGLGFLPNGGAPELGIPAVQTHYAALNSQIQGVNDQLPHAVLAYLLQVVLTHSGQTVEQALGLPDRVFARLAGDVLWGLTSDADGCPYEPDRTLAMGVALDDHFNLTFGLQPVTTENIGKPYAQSTFIGRDMTPQTRPDLRAEPGLGKAPRKADSRSEFQRLAGILHAKPYEQLPRALAQDDCETSTTACLMATNTVRSGDMSYEAFRNGTIGSATALPGAKGFVVFKDWADADVRAAAGFYGRVQQMLRSGALDISLVVGLAGGASATTQNSAQAGSGEVPPIDSRSDLGGHCFAVRRFRGAPGEDPEVGLLEGTSNVRTYFERPDGPQYRVMLGSKKADAIQKELPMSQFLTLLSSSVSLESQVVNRVIGGGGSGDDSRVGVQGPQDVPGFVRPTIVARSLHSLDLSTRSGSELGFYKWCLYTGLTADGADMGTLPLDDLEYRDQKGVGAGCRPAELCNRLLRGVGVAVSRDKVELGRKILSEVWPPLADLDTFRSVLNLWEPLPPLTRVNTDLGRYRQEGVSYATVACMETPASHALVDVVHEMNRQLFARANEVNAAKKNSDGILGFVYRIGTGVAKVLHVPERSGVHTYLASLREAKAEMGWAEPEVGAMLTRAAH